MAGAEQRHPPPHPCRRVARGGKGFHERPGGTGRPLRAAARTRDRAAGPDAGQEHCCSAQLTEAGDPLVRRAADDGALAPGVTTGDLLALITGIALATEHRPDPAADAQRLLGLSTAGLSPHQG